MKRGKNILLTAILTAAITQSAYAAEIPVECAPENATAESIAITENLISPILDEVQNGLGYQPAWCKVHNAVFNAVLVNETGGYGYLELRQFQEMRFYIIGICIYARNTMRKRKRPQKLFCQT